MVTQLVLTAVVIVIYFVVMFVSIKLTSDKLDAYSSGFGAGLANIVYGTLMFAITGVDQVLPDMGMVAADDLPILSYIVRFGLLLLALVGVVQVCVDLLMKINKIDEVQTELRESKPAPRDAVQQTAPETVPVWKRIEMEKERQ